MQMQISLGTWMVLIKTCDSRAQASDEIVYLAEMFHDIYEVEAQKFGWKSQTPVPFNELPEANKQTMLCTVARRTYCGRLGPAQGARRR